MIPLQQYLLEKDHVHNENYSIVLSLREYFLVPLLLISALFFCFSFNRPWGRV